MSQCVWVCVSECERGKIEMMQVANDGDGSRTLTPPLPSHPSTQHSQRYWGGGGGGAHVRVLVQPQPRGQLHLEAGVGRAAQVADAFQVQLLLDAHLQQRWRRPAAAASNDITSIAMLAEAPDLVPENS